MASIALRVRTTLLHLAYTSQGLAPVTSLVARQVAI